MIINFVYVWMRKWGDEEHVCMYDEWGGEGRERLQYKMTTLLITLFTV